METCTCFIAVPQFNNKKNSNYNSILNIVWSFVRQYFFSRGVCVSLLNSFVGLRNGIKSAAAARAFSIQQLRLRQFNMAREIIISLLALWAIQVGFYCIRETYQIFYLCFTSNPWSWTSARSVVDFRKKKFIRKWNWIRNRNATVCIEMSMELAHFSLQIQFQSLLKYPQRII